MKTILGFLFLNKRFQKIIKLDRRMGEKNLQLHQTKRRIMNSTKGVFKNLKTGQENDRKEWTITLKKCSVWLNAIDIILNAFSNR